MNYQLKYICPECKGILEEEDVKKKAQNWPDTNNPKTSKWGWKCKHCQGIVVIDQKGIIYCDKHQTLNENYGYARECHYGLGSWGPCQENHICQKCAEDFHQKKDKEHKKKSNNSYIEQFRKLNINNYAKGTWRHCGQVFKNLKEFIKHLENCSNIPHNKIHTSIIQTCEKCKKIIMEFSDNNNVYFEQDLPHDCQNEQKEEKKDIEKYMKENNVKNIRLLGNGELEIEYNDGNIKITKPNESILSQIKDKMIRDKQQIINQKQLQENDLSNKFTNPKSLIIFVGGIVLIGIGMIGLIYQIKKLKIFNNKND